MKVIVLSNGKFETKEIKGELEDLQNIVGGYIEIPFLSREFHNNDIDIIINEEGKLIDGLNPEIAVVDAESGNIIDLVYGNCIFVSHDEEGNTIELNEEQTQIVMEELETIVELMNKNTMNTFEVRVLFI